MIPALILHGGAGDFPDNAIEACQEGCRKALEAGWRILFAGGHALDAIEAAITILEDDPVFDAGFGSHLNQDGQVECDAIVMEAATLNAGSVAGLRHIKNPIGLARRVLESCPHMMLVSDGAERFASQQAIPLCDPAELVSPAEREAWSVCSKSAHDPRNHKFQNQGTVGAVAIDRQGRLFAATSTGGVCCKLPGRVGVTPILKPAALPRPVMAKPSCASSWPRPPRIPFVHRACGR